MVGTEPQAIRIGCAKNSKLWNVVEAIYSGKGKDIYDSHSTISVVKGRNGDLYIGTLGGGLSVRKAGQKRFTHFIYEKSNANSISDNYIECMVENKNGEIIIGTHVGLNI
ncbi:MAG: hypothetical protein H7Y10_15355 [Flavobacterium sp.]|nr:hypothetical protein [Flavobacterium sp.]